MYFTLYILHLIHSCFVVTGTSPFAIVLGTLNGSHTYQLAYSQLRKLTSLTNIYKTVNPDFAQSFQEIYIDIYKFLISLIF